MVTPERSVHSLNQEDEADRVLVELAQPLVVLVSVQLRVGSKQLDDRSETAFEAQEWARWAAKSLVVDTALQAASEVVVDDLVGFFEGAAPVLDEERTRGDCVHDGFGELRLASTGDGSGLEEELRVLDGTNQHPLLADWVAHELHLVTVWQYVDSRLRDLHLHVGAGLWVLVEERTLGELDGDSFRHVVDVLELLIDQNTSLIVISGERSNETFHVLKRVCDALNGRDLHIRVLLHFGQSDEVDV